jgi:hypothetical protein
MTSEKYTIISDQVTNQETCFFEKLIADDFQFYKGRMIPNGNIILEMVNDSLSKQYITKRILYLTKYRLNNDAYQYYQGINNQMDADNKLFDPVNPQIIGNITCTSDPDKLALGFFETSPVEYLSYDVAFEAKTGNAILTPKAYIIPAVKNGVSLTKPDFWDN